MVTQDSKDGPVSSNGETKPYNLIISFPRSGTDFFCSNLEKDEKIRYYREYFNPICNRPVAETLFRGFGCEGVGAFYNILNECDEAVFDQIVEATWKKTRLNTTKENFSATKLGFFVKSFNTVCLIRNMSHTFPTSQPAYIEPIHVSFMCAGDYSKIFLADELNALKEFIRHIKVTDSTEAGILGYLVQHYILVTSCRRYDIPIIRYEDLVVKSGNDLAAYLACVGRFGVDVAALARRLEQNRKEGGDDMLAKRRSRFAPYLERPWIDTIIGIMKALSPGDAAAIERHLTPVR